MEMPRISRKVVLQKISVASMLIGQIFWLLSKASRFRRNFGEGNKSGTACAGSCAEATVMVVWILQNRTVTIDGEDAKDLDDAVSLTKENGIYHLGVHIADVSNYVQGGSALDKEALKRGTSVYLADRVVPMLPERLSNGICSLNQGEDRLTLSCLMDIDETGCVVNHQIAETIIRVDRRMSYNQVREILEDGDTEISRECRELVPMFFLMKELSALLRGRRHNRGSIDFDFPESKIILNGAGRAIDVQPYEHNVATDIIEDFMLMANETVAKEYKRRISSFVYRACRKIRIRKELSF